MKKILGALLAALLVCIPADMTAFAAEEVSCRPLIIFM